MKPLDCVILEVMDYAPIKASALMSLIKPIYSGPLSMELLKKALLRLIDGGYIRAIYSHSEQPDEYQKI